VPEQELVMDSNPTQTRMQYRVATTFSYLPDRPGSGNLTSDTSTALGVVARGVERYDHFRKEVGFQFEYYRSGVALISPSAASSTSFWTKLNVAALFLHSWNLARYPDNPQFARGSLLLGIGGFFSPGHLAPLARTAYEWRLGRHWATALHLGYRFRSTVYSSGISVGQAGGVDSGFGIHYLF
jgi:hypothetical protein